MGALIALGGVELRGYAFSSPTFDVRSVEVEGARRVSVAEVREAADLQDGQRRNVFSVDLWKAQQAVESLSWVRSARVERKLPDGVFIEVIEHEAVALVALGALYFVNEDGEVFRAFVPGDPIGLPVITGVSRNDFLQGRSEASDQIETALAFLSAARSAFGHEGPQVVEVEVSKLGWVRFGTRTGHYIRIGPSPWKDALLSVIEALALAERRGEGLLEITVGRGRKHGQVWVRPRPGGDRRE